MGIAKQARKKVGTILCALNNPGDPDSRENVSHILRQRHLQTLAYTISRDDIGIALATPVDFLGGSRCLRTRDTDFILGPSSLES